MRFRWANLKVSPSQSDYYGDGETRGQVERRFLEEELQ